MAFLLLESELNIPPKLAVTHRDRYAMIVLLMKILKNSAFFSLATIPASLGYFLTPALRQRKPRIAKRSMGREIMTSIPPEFMSYLIASTSFIHSLISSLGMAFISMAFLISVKTNVALLGICTLSIVNRQSS